MLVASTHGDAARERDVVAQMLSRRVSGHAVGAHHGDHAWLHTKTPLVLVDRAAPGLEADVVGIDDAAAAADAVRHLVAHGHRGSPTSVTIPLVPTSRARLAGYRRAMAAHGLDGDPRFVRAECPDATSAAAATPRPAGGQRLRSPDGALQRGHPMLARRRADPARHRPDGRRVGLLRRLRHGRPAATRRHGRRPLGRGRRRGGRARLAERIAQPDLPASIIHVPVRLIPRGSGEMRPVTERTASRSVGIDIGTTMSKALLRTPSGEQLALVEVRTPWTTTPDGGTESSAECFVELAIDLLRRGYQRASAGRPLRVSAVAVAGLAESGVLLDGSGLPRTPVVAWFDRRGTAQIDSISLRDNGFGPEYTN